MVKFQGKIKSFSFGRAMCHLHPLPCGAVHEHSGDAAGRQVPGVVAILNVQGIKYIFILVLPKMSSRYVV